jgi:hypothetical protein
MLLALVRVSNEFPPKAVDSLLRRHRMRRFMKNTCPQTITTLLLLPPLHNACALRSRRRGCVLSRATGVDETT